VLGELLEVELRGHRGRVAAALLVAARLGRVAIERGAGERHGLDQGVEDTLAVSALEREAHELARAAQIPPRVAAPRAGGRARPARGSEGSLPTGAT
jgi:hypothetical protein